MFHCNEKGRPLVSLVVTVFHGLSRFVTVESYVITVESYVITWESYAVTWESCVIT